MATWGWWTLSTIFAETVSVGVQIDIKISGSSSHMSVGRQICSICCFYLRSCLGIAGDVKCCLTGACVLWGWYMLMEVWRGGCWRVLRIGGLHSIGLNQWIGTICKPGHHNKCQFGFRLSSPCGMVVTWDGRQGGRWRGQLSTKKQWKWILKELSDGIGSAA